jgi:tRNA pseudouridine38-40 synthase
MMTTKHRFLLEVSYVGEGFSGFQRQENAITIQSAFEHALAIYFRQSLELTGSSRTDAGVHAAQNFFHVDVEDIMIGEMLEAMYGVNAILPEGIVWKGVKAIDESFHARFDAKFREYEYTVYQRKDPFLLGRGYYFPFKLEEEMMIRAAKYLEKERDYRVFSKKHTQVKHFVCDIQESEWLIDGHVWRYRVRGNRFLRGMVRGLVGTMLRVGRGKISEADWVDILEGGGADGRVDFSAPAMGLKLLRVGYVEER